MINSFNTNIACTYSINSAIFVQHLAQWVFVNLANRRHIHQGRCWSYNTLDAFQHIFPYWTYKQIRTVINNAIKDGLIIKGNFNKTNYDRTCWYALTDKALEYYPEFHDEKIKSLLVDSDPNDELEDELLNINACLNGKIDLPKWADGNAKKGRPIPTNNSTNKKVIYKYITKKPAFDLFWSLYPVKKAKQICWQYWNRHKLEKHAEEIMQALQKQIASDDHFLKGYIRNPLKYLREEGWLDPINEAKEKQSNGKDNINYLLLGL